MIDWLLDIGRTYLNKDRVAWLCKAMLCVSFLPLLVLAIGILTRTNLKGPLAILGQISQLLFDIGLALLCLALLRVVYDKCYKIPIIGFYAVLTIIKGVYLFFITSNGTKQGELFTLIFALSLLMHIIVGVQLLKTEFVKFGKAFLYYIGGIILAAVIGTMDDGLLSPLIMLSTCGVLAYIFYKYLPTYYE